MLLAAILLVLGGLNWFLVGAFEFDLVKYIFSSLPPVQRGIHIVVGLAAFYQIFQWKAIQNRWKAYYHNRTVKFAHVDLLYWAICELYKN
jgi:uncharacterized membrane protein YuzA (DUF378 family)